MKLAVDCRMCGKSGIGAFIDGILPHLLATEHQFVLLGLDAQHKIASLPDSVYAAQNGTLLPCTIPPFSLTETCLFPRALAHKLNACDAFISPYCNIPSGLRIPRYTTIHDIVFLDMPDIAGRIGTAARKFFYHRAIRKSQGIFTVSAFTKGRIQEKLACKKPIFVVHSSVPAYLQEPLSPLPAKTNTIIFIGNIKRHKGLHTLIPAFAAFRTACENAHEPLPHLLIVGSREHFRTQDDSFAALIDQTDGISFTGFISNDELKLRLSEARLLVQPSLYEGFGLPPMEALCCGTRALVSDIPVFKEVYEGLPVAYFSAGDSDDLMQKMRALWHDTTPFTPVQNRYAFAKTAQHMLAVLSDALTIKRPQS